MATGPTLYMLMNLLKYLHHLARRQGWGTITFAVGFLSGTVFLILLLTHHSDDALVR